MLYKFVGFAFLILNLGPYLIDFGQTINELLFLKSFQQRNWKRKSKSNKFFLVLIITPIGPMVIVIKKFLRLVQGVSILSVEIAEMFSSTKYEK